MSAIHDADARALRNNPLGYEVTAEQARLARERANSPAKKALIDRAIEKEAVNLAQYQQGLITPMELADDRIRLWCNTISKLRELE